jgi:cell division protein FtsZ
MRTAEGAIEELSQYVDTLLIIPNQNLFRVATERTTFADAFKMADDVLYSGVRGVTDLMIMPGLINLDFADIRTVMSEMGKAMMGTGEAEGEKRAIAAAEAAISNPLLDDTSMKGAKGVLINITGGMDMTLFEVDEAANRIRDEVDPDANIIFGSTFDEKLNGKMRVSVVATGIASEAAQQPKPTVISLAPTQPAPAQMRTAPQQSFRPTVVTAAAAAVAEPAAAQAKVMPVEQAADDLIDTGLDLARPEPRVERAEPTFRTEPRIERTEPNMRPVARDEQPSREMLRPQPEMAGVRQDVNLRAQQDANLRAQQDANLRAQHEANLRAQQDANLRAQQDANLRAQHEANLRAQQDARAQSDMAALSRAVADIADTPSHHPQQVRQPEPEPRRMGGLFDLLRRPSRHHHQQQPVQEQQAQPAAPAPQPSQPRMAAPRGEPTVARASEDLDIPAFLRRQAN